MEGIYYLLFRIYVFPQYEYWNTYRCNALKHRCKGNRIILPQTTLLFSLLFIMLLYVIFYSLALARAKEHHK